MVVLLTSMKVTARVVMFSANSRMLMRMKVSDGSDRVMATKSLMLRVTLDMDPSRMALPSLTSLIVVLNSPKP